MESLNIKLNAQDAIDIMFEPVFVDKDMMGDFAIVKNLYAGEYKIGLLSAIKNVTGKLQACSPKYKGVSSMSERSLVAQYVEAGTVDCIITGKDFDDKHQVHVIDFKFGYGVKVDAYMNFQLLNYAKGYIKSNYHTIKDYDLHLHIFQPTFSNSCWSLDEEEKYKWIISDNFYKNVVSKCKKLEPEFNPSVKACKFCRAKSICKPLSTNIVIKDKYTLTTDEIKDFLDKKELILLNCSRC